MSDEGEEYEPDFDLHSEEPYSCCSVRCIICKRRRARYTEREYTSDRGYSQSGEYYNFGEYCPATKCCNGPVCLNCAAFNSYLGIFCNFCREQTTVCFLPKDTSGKFSNKTNSLCVNNWLVKLWNFQMVQDKLGATCQFFFYWLRNYCLKELEWFPDLYSWHDLCLDRPMTQRLMLEFGTFTNISQMVFAQNFFCNRFQIRASIDPLFGCIIASKREQIRASFLHAWYDLSFSSSFKQIQIGFVGTLAVRLSSSNQKFDNYMARTIFNRIMKNLIFPKM
jgi:hypothetical protein